MSCDTGTGSRSSSAADRADHPSMLRTIGRWWRDFDDRRLSGRGLLLYVLIVVGAWSRIDGALVPAVVMGELLPLGRSPSMLSSRVLLPLSLPRRRAPSASAAIRAPPKVPARPSCRAPALGLNGALYALADAVERYWRDRTRPMRLCARRPCADARG
jgi:hypothetical protein